MPASIIKNPAGTFHLVGSVPASIAFVDAKTGEPATAKQLKAARHAGPGIAGIKTKTYATHAAAADALSNAPGTQTRDPLAKDRTDIPEQRALRDVFLHIAERIANPDHPLGTFPTLGDEADAMLAAVAPYLAELEKVREVLEHIQASPHAHCQQVWNALDSIDALPAIGALRKTS